MSLDMDRTVCPSAFPTFMVLSGAFEVLLRSCLAVSGLLVLNFPCRQESQIRRGLGRSKKRGGGRKEAVSEPKSVQP